MVNSKKSSTFAAAKEKHRGVEQLVARQAHNLEVACSSPASATTAAFYGLLFLSSQNIVHAPGRSSSSPSEGMGDVKNESASSHPTARAFK